jgi:hypothetical protein
MNIKPSDQEAKLAIACILTESLLRIRREAAFGHHEACEIEADHVHNLPHLLADFSEDLLAFYYNTERKVYLAQTGGNYPHSYEDAWKTVARRLGSLALV